ncbi:MAG: type VI secretion system contractile sheath large subunit [Planctomycetaceae bacterium]
MANNEQKQAVGTESAQTAASATPLLDQLATYMPKSYERDEARGLIETIVDGALKKTFTIESSLVKTVNSAVAKIDEMLSAELATIMHHPELQKLEGSWRGLKHLVHESNTGKDMKITLLNTTKGELQKDFAKASEFDQNFLWKQIYAGCYGQAGADPYGLLVGDFEFGNDNMDLDLLSKIAGVSASAFAPFISAASPDLFGVESYEDIPRIRDLASIFADKTKYIKWNAFREADDSRYVTMTLPRVLAREPYGTANTRIDEFKYEEFPLSRDGRFSEEVEHGGYTWMNSAYAYAARITKAFEETGWCTRIRGYESGGMVENLPTHVFKTDDGEHLQKCPSEILIEDRREKEFSDLGFLPLVNWKNSDKSVFIGAQTVHKPKKYMGDTLATENEQISARLPYIMASSRMAHYLKVIAREKIGAFMEQEELEKFLQKWISSYVLDSNNATQEQKAKFPLREARITVEKIPGRSGAYNARVDLRPWLQLEELHASVSMVAEIQALK